MFVLQPISVHTISYNSGSESEVWSTKKYGNPYHSIKIKGPNNPSPRYPQHINKFYSSASIITIPQKYFGENHSS